MRILCIFLALVFCSLVFAAPPKKAQKQPVKKETATFKKFNENDPKTTADNTITVIQGGREIERPIHGSWGQAHLKMFQDKDVNLTSTYNPETGDYIVTNVVPFAQP
jgi:hypothetical protein